jgi:hypothetical protein
LHAIALWFTVNPNRLQSTHWYPSNVASNLKVVPTGSQHHARANASAGPRHTKTLERNAPFLDGSSASARNLYVRRGGRTKGAFG